MMRNKSRWDFNVLCAALSLGVCAESSGRACAAPVDAISIKNLNTQNTVNSQHQMDTIRVALLWLPRTAEAQAETFAYLAGKVGRRITRPIYPKNSLLTWQADRYHLDPEAADEPKELYPLAYEDLLIAQNLLRSKDQTQRRRGLRVASACASRIGPKLQDKWLRAQIEEAFVLPYLDAAYPQGWKALGRVPLLWKAWGSFRVAGETLKEERMLRLLVQIASSPNQADQARVHLARLFTEQQKYEDAIALLDSIETASMSGAKKSIPELRQKAEEKKTQKQDLKEGKKS